MPKNIKTLTVGQLLKLLKKLNPKTKVYAGDCAGMSYGRLTGVTITKNLVEFEYQETMHDGYDIEE